MNILRKKWRIIYNYGMGLQYHIVYVKDKDYNNFIHIYNSMKKICGDYGGMLEFDENSYTSKEDAEKACYLKYYN